VKGSKATAARTSPKPRRRRAAAAPEGGRARTDASRAGGEGGPRRRLRFAHIVEIGGLVSAVAAVVGLVFVFAPGLKPDPPAPEKGADFTQVVAEPNVTREHYLRRLDQGPGDYSRGQLRTPGVIAAFNVSITGHRGEALPLRWGIYDAANGRQVYREKATTLRPEAANDEASMQVWAPLPRGGGLYYVLFQLFETDGTVVIDHARSPTFAGLVGSARGAQ
jgi:hypothetical protein